MNTVYEQSKETDKDHVATPRYVVEGIYEKIGVEKYKAIWFPFNNYDSEFKLKADELKLKYKATHIFDDVGNDFFHTAPPPGCDLLISNPPFSKQNDIIRHTFDLIENGKIKAFCLLLPITTLETPYRGDMYKKWIDKLSVLFFKKRIKFIGRENNFNKGCCWVCYNIDALAEKKIDWI